MRIGITASTFDLLHAGHIEMLRDAKSQCDYLICALQIDPSIDRPSKNRPAQTIVERYTQLSAVSFVDEIIPYLHERDLEDILQMRKINVRILGEDYIGKRFTGDNLPPKIIYTSRAHGWSTTKLKNDITIQTLKDNPSVLKEHPELLKEIKKIK